MKKFYLYALALCALTACGNKSEKVAGEEAKQDSTTQVNEAKKAADVVEAEKPAADEEAAPKGNDFSMPALMEKPCAVKGGVGVKNFFKAILLSTSEYYADTPQVVDEFLNEEELITVDEKNGYLHFLFQEGDNWDCMELCYWMRTDGSILVAFYDDSHYAQFVSENDFDYTMHSTLTFFIYDKEKKELVPVAAPMEVSIGKDEHICWTLPQKGKDISYVVRKAGGVGLETSTFNLKFDGMKFIK